VLFIDAAGGLCQFLTLCSIDARPEIEATWAAASRGAVHIIVRHQAKAGQVDTV